MFVSVALYGKMFIGGDPKYFCKLFPKSKGVERKSLPPKMLVVFILGLDFVIELWTMSSFRGFISVLCVYWNRMFSM